MTGSKEIFEEMREAELQDERFPPIPTGPRSVEILPGSILVLNKANAADFHQRMKEMIRETGYGLFEYLEAIKFFEKVKACINGDKQAKIPEDKEFIGMIRDEILKYPKGVLTTERGVKFEAAETGTAYDFSQCNDASLLQLEQEAAAAADKLKERKEFLKKLPGAGIEVLDKETGEVASIYPPSKSSNSSYKITMK